MIYNPGWGKMKSQDPRSGIRDEKCGSIFWGKTLKFFDVDPGSCQPWILDGKNRIRDKHPG